MHTLSARASFSNPSFDEQHSGLCRTCRAGHPDDPGFPSDDYAEADQSERCRVIVHRTPRQYIAPEPPEISVIIGKVGHLYRASIRRPDGRYINCGTQSSEAAAWDIALLVAQAVLAGAA